jgi:hypothetical protein
MMGKSVEEPDEEKKAALKKLVIGGRVSSLQEALVGRSFSRVEEEEMGRSVGVVGWWAEELEELRNWNRSKLRGRTWTVQQQGMQA